MLKKDLIDLINKFETETWKYENSDGLEEDMEYIYSMENEIKNAGESSLKALYEKITALIGVIRFKYGFEGIIIKSNPELKNLNEIINGFSLANDNIIEQYNYISTVFNNFTNKNKNLSFIVNNYINVPGKEGLYLAVESLKSLITNSEYRQLLDENQINDILVDCIMLNSGKRDVKKLELKYRDLINKIWANALSNKVEDNGNFRILFSNISGGSLSNQASLLLNRPSQASCSMISSNFIAAYGSSTRKIGFIYPNNSQIVMSSAYDLGSNVFGEGVVNKEKGTLLATPVVMEKIGIERTKQKGENKYSSSCYNEVLVNAKPCGIAIIGLGEKDLNIYYQEAIKLSEELNLPIYYIDAMDYKEELSENEKYYIAFHSIVSYLNISPDDLLDTNNDYTELNNVINAYREQITEIFLTLKKNGNLSKENMCKMIEEQTDIKQILGNNSMHR